MNWSRYNYIYSIEDGVFIYNSRSTSFLKINKEIKHIIDLKSFNKLSNDVYDLFVKNKIIVSEGEDDSYFSLNKLANLKRVYNQKNLSLTIAPTTGCNFACPYCFEEGILAKHITADVEEKLLEFIRNQNPDKLRITWYGGEPLLKFNTIKKLSLQLEQYNFIKNISYSIITNGYLLNKECCDFFKDHNMKEIQVTIDGLPETHNKTRIHKCGKGTYDIITRNLDYAINTMPKCKFKIRVNVNHDNIKEYAILKKTLQKRWKSENVNIYYSYIENCGDEDKNCLSVNNKYEFIKSILQDKGLSNEIKYLKHTLGGCTANIINSYVVGPDGSLYKCWQDLGVSTKVIGSIFNNICTKPTLLANYLTDSSKFNDNVCKECFLMPVCSGGCSLKRYENKFKNANHNICPYSQEEIKLFLNASYNKIKKNA